MLNAYSAYSGASLKATYTGAAACTNHTGTISTVKGVAYVPASGGYTTTVTGTHTAKLTGPTGTDFDLYLEEAQRHYLERRRARHHREQHRERDLQQRHRRKLPVEGARLHRHRQLLALHDAALTGR